jgi:hypothetical protein
MNDDLAYIGSLSGEAYAYLGHFRSRACIAAGHNTDDAESIDETVAAFGEGRMPGSKASDQPQGA